MALQNKPFSMKKIIIAFAFSLFITNSFAQHKKFRFGLQFTNGLSFLKSDNVNIADSKVGYAFGYGLKTEFYFDENYGISTGLTISHPRASRSNSPGVNEVIFDTTSTYANDNFLVPGIKETYKFNYIEIPFTFKLRTNEIGYFRYFGEFGLVNSFRVRSRLSLVGSSIENESISKKLAPFDLRSNFFNASLKVGGGFEYTFSDKTALVVELSFNNGFVNVLKDGDDKRTVLRVVNLSTGIMF
ncbi:MAG: hypothetical protein ACI8V8_000208 [Chitinophagales bacterium]|jgi:hypothetical protein